MSHVARPVVPLRSSASKGWPLRSGVEAHSLPYGRTIPPRGGPGCRAAALQPVLPEIRSGMDLGVIAGSIALAASVAVPVAGLGLAVGHEGHVGIGMDEWQRGARASSALMAVVGVCVLAAAVIGVRIGRSPVLPAFVVTVVVGIVLAVVDARRRRLPFVFTGLICAVCVGNFGLVSVIVGDASSLTRSVLAGIVTSLAFLLVALVFAGQLGLGDVAFVGALALSLGWLGWQHVATGVMASLVVQLVAFVVSRLRSPGPTVALAMGPALLAGWMIGVLTPGP